MTDNTTTPAPSKPVAGPVQRPVGRLEPERAYGDEPYWYDRDEPFDEPTCERCHGDGMDPWCDYLMPCPLCQGEQH